MVSARLVHMPAGSGASGFATKLSLYLLAKLARGSQAVGDRAVVRALTFTWLTSSRVTLAHKASTGL